MSHTAALALLTTVLGTIGYHLAQWQIAPDASPALVLGVAYLIVCWFLVSSAVGQARWRSMMTAGLCQSIALMMFWLVHTG